MYLKPEKSDSTITFFLELYRLFYSGFIIKKMFAATATYLYQVVRSRLQVRTVQGLFDVVQNGAALPM